MGQARGDRHVIVDNDTRIEVSLLVDRLLQQSGGQIVYRQVSLVDRPDVALWLVAKPLQRKDRPLIVLSSLRCENLQQAQQVLGYYRLLQWLAEQITGVNTARFPARAL